MNCDNASLLLYAVTDRSWLHGQTLYEQAEQALQGGATFLQLREKELDEAHFQEEAIALKALCKQYGVPFVLDDNVALAVATDADGVHVGQSDMAAGKVRALIGPDKILGVSAQTSGSGIPWPAWSARARTISAWAPCSRPGRRPMPTP